MNAQIVKRLCGDFKNQAHLKRDEENETRFHILLALMADQKELELDYELSIDTIYEMAKLGVALMLTATGYEDESSPDDDHLYGQPVIGAKPPVSWVYSLSVRTEPVDWRSIVSNRNEAFDTKLGVALKKLTK